MSFVRHRRPALLAVLAVSAAALLGAGCGDDDGAREHGHRPRPRPGRLSLTTTQAPEEPAAPKARKVKPTAGEADLDRKPKVPKGKGEAPTKLVVQDLIVGKGKRAKSGDTVSVKYVGVLFKNAKEFDASWKGGEGQTFQFPLGAGQVIPGVGPGWRA